MYCFILFFYVVYLIIIITELPEAERHWGPSWAGSPAFLLTKNFLRKHKDVKNNSLFAYILVLIKRLPDLSSKKQLLKDIETVLEKYEDDIDKTLLGFPSDYKTIMKNNI